MEIMNHIEKQLTRSQQGWVDDLAQVLWVHKTLPRNSQKETPFSLTYGSEAIIPIAENAVAKDDKGRTKGVTKKKEGKEVASIEEAYYQNKLRKYHHERSSHSTYKIGDFILLSQNDTGNLQRMEWLSGKRQQELESSREQAFKGMEASSTVRGLDGGSRAMIGIRGLGSRANDWL
ncbi:reverse transcriptase domain-containing protein, partial [Tanacetum coccineum]